MNQVNASKHSQPSYASFRKSAFGSYTQLREKKIDRTARQKSYEQRPLLHIKLISHLRNTNIIEIKQTAEQKVLACK